MKYAALLRGINVGKSVQVNMGELKSILAGLGLPGAETYLNSGNAVFESDRAEPELQGLIESALERRYGQRIPALVVDGPRMVRIAESIPPEWVNDGTEQTYVAYLFKPAAYPALVDELPIKREFATLYYAEGCIVWNIKRENYNRSHITKIAQHAAYDLMTTRNVNTARKLAELCRE